MHVSHPLTVKRINQLMLAGYVLPNMPEWRTNQGWTMNVSTHDIPGKIGFICTHGFKYGLLVGDLVDGLLINIEVEFSGDSNDTDLIDYFYQQLGIYLDRVVALFKPSGTQTEITREVIKQLDNSILQTAWANMPKGAIEHTVKLYLDNRPSVLTIKRKCNGNGVITVEALKNNFFYIQFEKGLVVSFNAKGFTRGYVMSELGNILTSYKGTNQLD